jgi:hypothetical protein
MPKPPKSAAAKLDFFDGGTETPVAWAAYDATNRLVAVTTTEALAYKVIVPFGRIEGWTLTQYLRFIHAQARQNSSRKA